MVFFVGPSWVLFCELSVFVLGFAHCACVFDFCGVLGGCYGVSGFVGFFVDFGVGLFGFVVE
jgi:hypothetical protein